MISDGVCNVFPSHGHRMKAVGKIRERKDGCCLYRKAERSCMACCPKTNNVHGV